VIILDHNIPQNQVEQLRRWKVHFKQIGFEVGRPEWDDQQKSCVICTPPNNPRSSRATLAFFGAAPVTRILHRRTRIAR
jgi:hypothetical protein